eukprot:3629302-Rhodomonas_salina.1
METTDNYARTAMAVSSHTFRAEPHERRPLDATDGVFKNPPPKEDPNPEPPEPTERRETARSTALFSADADADTFDTDAFSAVDTGPNAGPYADPYTDP